MWGDGIVPPKTMNVAGFYLLLLSLYIHPECEVLAQTISEINTKQEYRN